MLYGKLHAWCRQLLTSEAAGNRSSASPYPHWGRSCRATTDRPFGHATRADGYELRLEAVKHGVTHVTNLAGAQAMVAGMEAARLGGLAAVALQDLPQWELSR